MAGLPAHLRAGSKGRHLWLCGWRDRDQDGCAPVSTRAATRIPFFLSPVAGFPALSAEELSLLAAPRAPLILYQSPLNPC